MNCIKLKSRHVDAAGKPQTQQFNCAEVEWVDLTERKDKDGNNKGWMLVCYFDITDGNLKRESEANKPTVLKQTFCFWAGATDIVIDQLDMLANDLDDWLVIGNKTSRAKLATTLTGLKFTAKVKEGGQGPELEFRSVSLS